MDSLRFADNLDNEAVVALGLPAPRLALAGLGAAGSWALTELPAPAPVRLGLACLLALTTATLAWGRLEEVSLARWSWLALGYARRVVEARWGADHRWFDAEPGPSPGPGLGAGRREPACVGFLSVRPGSGCSAVCRAVASELEATAGNPGGHAGDQRGMPIWLVPAQDRGSTPALILCDWGSEPPCEPPGTRLTGVVVVWDGVEAFPHQLASQVGVLRGTHPAAPVLVALNRAGPSTGLASLVLGAGASLVAAFPEDRSLGDLDRTVSEAVQRPSAAGVRALARAVVATSGHW